MSVWDQPSPSDFDRWEALLLKGVEPKTAAEQVGFTVSAFKRSDRDRHADALQMGREARGHVVDQLVEKDVLVRDDDGAPVAYKVDASDSMKQFHARRWQPAYTDRTQIDLGGRVEVTLEPDFGRIIEGLERIGVLRRGTPEALDAQAVKVLPAPSD